jgi:hypothetical protein
MIKMETIFDHIREQLTEEFLQEAKAPKVIQALAKRISKFKKRVSPTNRKIRKIEKRTGGKVIGIRKRKLVSPKEMIRRLTTPRKKW